MRHRGRGLGLAAARGVRRGGDRKTRVRRGADRATRGRGPKLRLFARSGGGEPPRRRHPAGAAKPPPPGTSFLFLIVHLHTCTRAPPRRAPSLQRRARGRRARQLHTARVRRMGEVGALVAQNLRVRPPLHVQALLVVRERLVPARLGRGRRLERVVAALREGVVARGAVGGVVA